MILFKARLLGRVGIKKNGRRLFVSRYGKPGFATSENYQTFHKSASLQLLQAKTLSHYPMPIQGPINLSCTFHFPDHRGEADLSNLYQGIEDILQEIGIIENDKYIYSHNGSRKIFGSEDFFTYIEITKHDLSHLDTDKKE